MKSIFIAIVLIALLTLAPLQVIAQDECTGNLNACMELLDECDGAECPACPIIAPCPEKNCTAECGWVTLVKDKTFMSAIIGGLVLIIGGLAGIFIVPN